MSLTLFTKSGPSTYSTNANIKGIRILPVKPGQSIPETDVLAPTSKFRLLSYPSADGDSKVFSSIALSIVEIDPDSVGGKDWTPMQLARSVHMELLFRKQPKPKDEICDENIFAEIMTLGPGFIRLDDGSLADEPSPERGSDVVRGGIDVVRTNVND